MKEEPQKLLNIGFKNSTFLITVIMLTRKVFAVSINESVNSRVFIKFEEKLKYFTAAKNKTSIDRCFIILDNAVIHCSIYERIFKNKLNLAYLPPELPLFII